MSEFLRWKKMGILNIIGNGGKIREEHKVRTGEAKQEKNEGIRLRTLRGISKPLEAEGFC